MTTFKLPDLGEGLTESEIVRWLVAEGDTVELNQILAEVETAKAVVDLPSPYAGVVRRLHAAEGETIAVGAPLIEYDVEGAEPTDAPAPAAEAPEPEEQPAPARPVEERAPAQERVSVLVGSVKVGSGARATRRRRTFEPTPFVRDERRPARAFPPVRALARQRGIDLSSVEPTGEDGVVTRADLDRLSIPAAAPTAAPARASRRERVTGLRKHTAKAMTDSAFSAPHAAVFLQVDVTETTQLVADLKARARGGAAPTFLSMACRAILLAAARTPEVNSTFHADANEIEVHGAVHLGIAVATDRGLVVASVDDADLLDATDLAGRIREQAEKAREGRLSPAELTSSTMTVSNVGVFGVDGGVPILNPGESVILALGTVRRTPWEHRGEIALRDVMQITVSFDHRVLDGKEASAFIADVGALLEHPGLALARS
ncbi:dihydrolipoamide acetyltransferase family protein [Agrococcus jejuensis]|uniref:Dihydrolipoamide acetyltransferase component of pyruvate dehydrogenase complex n=1 Tax=Agrococcus jejuensis TaxID=399736 RepID=A0A1G8GXP2_9MICO|nr:dihydrolipoamide acetyltransferase family protein [Agrococcus jejuensis]SDH99195.1 pyruvate dehydrogenase E2 component (dihydrolipoamide acetyltransferase) [Agrococcus jejuensis]